MSGGTRRTAGRSHGRCGSLRWSWSWSGYGGQYGSGLISHVTRVHLVIAGEADTSDRLGMGLEPHAGDVAEFERDVHVLHPERGTFLRLTVNAQDAV